MGGVDLVNANLDPVPDKGEEVGPAWVIYWVTNLDEDQPLVFFVQSLVQSYLHLDAITTGKKPRF